MDQAVVIALARGALPTELVAALSERGEPEPEARAVVMWAGDRVGAIRGGAPPPWHPPRAIRAAADQLGRGRSRAVVHQELVADGFTPEDADRMLACTGGFARVRPPPSSPIALGAVLVAAGGFGCLFGAGVGTITAARGAFLVLRGLGLDA